MSSIARTKLASSARKAALLCAIGWSVAPLAQATTVSEIGDAGQTRTTAQVTNAPGALSDIFGSLASTTDADLFLIRITNPATFSASTVSVTGGVFDTQLFLLTAAGAPLFFNDDEASGLTTLSRLPASAGFASLASGLYILGVSVSGYNPVNTANQLLFANGLTTSVRGAASGLQPAVLGGFSNDTFFDDMGAYDIQLSGATAAVPEPEISLMLLAGGAFCAFAARRRRKAAPAAIPA